MSKWAEKGHHLFKSLAQQKPTNRIFAEYRIANASCEPNFAETIHSKVVNKTPTCRSLEWQSTTDWRISRLWYFAGWHTSYDRQLGQWKLSPRHPPASAVCSSSQLSSISSSFLLTERPLLLLLFYDLSSCCC